MRGGGSIGISVSALKDVSGHIPMDGKGRWMDDTKTELSFPKTPSAAETLAFSTEAR